MSSAEMSSIPWQALLTFAAVAVATFYLVRRAVSAARMLQRTEPPKGENGERRTKVSPLGRLDR